MLDRGVLQGVTTALITPMHADGELDPEGLSVHVRYQLEQGVRCLVTCGTIGEYPSLNRAERRAIVEQVASEVSRQSAVLACVADNDPRQILGMAEDAAAAGADGVLATLPCYFALEPEEQIEFWRWFDERTPLPYLIYNPAGAPHLRPSADVVSSFPDLRHVIGVKEASADVRRLQDVARLLNSRLPLVAASEIVAPLALHAGAEGLMTSTACFAPGRLRAVVAAVNAGDSAATERAFAAVRRMRQAFQDKMDQGYPAFIPYTKAACEIVGLPSGPPRRPLRPLTASEHAALKDSIEAAWASHQDG